MELSRNLGEVRTADGNELVLYERAGVYTIRIGGLELMSSRAHGSEEELARLACASMPSRPQPLVLIGGLGMGFTVRAALSCLPPEARVLVCEIFPAVMAWNRGPLADVAGRPLEDARVRPLIMDVADLIEASASGGHSRTLEARLEASSRLRIANEVQSAAPEVLEVEGLHLRPSGAASRASSRLSLRGGVPARPLGGPFDAILLDVDNGPEPLTLETNRRLYDHRGVEHLHDALAAGGVLALWSASPDEGFERRLASAGLEVNRHETMARPGTRGPCHEIYLARRPGCSRS